MESSPEPSRRPAVILPIVAALALGLAALVTACGPSPSRSSGPSDASTATGTTTATGAPIDPAWVNVIAGRPAFWLGHEVDGLPVADVRDVDGRILVEYGPCMAQPEPTDECVRQLWVTTQTPRVWESQIPPESGEPASPEGDCRREPPVLGAPTAILLGELTAFTGPSLVGVTYWRTIPDGFAPDHATARRLIGRLRPIEQATPAALPPPNSETARFLDRVCLR